MKDKISRKMKHGVKHKTTEHHDSRPNLKHKSHSKENYDRSEDRQISLL